MCSGDGKASSLLAKWMDEGGFRCGQCGDARLVLTAEAVVCRGCTAH